MLNENFIKALNVYFTITNIFFNSTKQLYIFWNKRISAKFFVNVLFNKFHEKFECYTFISHNCRIGKEMF